MLFVGLAISGVMSSLICYISTFAIKRGVPPVHFSFTLALPGRNVQPEFVHS